ncbi:MAG: hypothetical protein U9Q66_02945 [Patescibacteria group bacterium]|nr:hypothetical protein [Patescibacteria group bacterium]
MTDFLTYDYKRIPSTIYHKSPDAEELTVQLNNKVTYSLPVDRDRYVDFISAK